MFSQKTRIALLTGLLLVATALPVHAIGRRGGRNSCPPQPCYGAAPDVCAMAPAPAPAPAPVTRKIMVTEWKAEQYETTRTTYKIEWKEQKFTEYKSEIVPVEKTRMVPYVKRVEVTEDLEVTRWVCEKSEEERMVSRWVVSTKPVERLVTRTVDVGGAYECREVPCGSGGSSGCGQRRGLFRRGCGSGGGDSCGAGTMTVNVYVPKYQTVQDKVVVQQRVCELVSEKAMVPVFKNVAKKETIKVTRYKSEVETREEKYTVYERKVTPVEVTRQVGVRTPVEEKVMATRMVPHQVEKEVVISDVCGSGGSGYGGDCGSGYGGGGRRGLFRRGCR